MEFRAPKVLEKTPEVWGFALSRVAVILASGLGLLFLGFYNLPVALLFPTFGGIFFYIDTKFPAKGELIQYITYNTGNKCIHCDRSIRSLTNKEPNTLDTE